ncbi:MAG: AAA family ATPase [Syntrophobacteraceae bacterium]
MKLLRLNLIAFGPFTDVSLNLNEGRGGLHLIYGPNEAGKSSALRAIRNLFYGIPERSPDDFKHPYGKLRIGGILGNGAGEDFEFIRRKGRVGTLRGPDDSTVVADSALSALLGGIDEEDFSKRFGIDHETLVCGGREIVEGGGELAAALFAAGSGIAGFRAIQESLKSEMDLLFKANASKPGINDALAKLRDEQKRLREAQLSGNEWVQHDKALRDAVEQRSRIQTQLEEKSRESARLERVLKALPVIGRWTSLARDLEPLSDTVILPLGFSEKRREAVTELRNEEQSERRTSESLAKIEMELAGLNVSETLLDNAGEIDRFYLDLGSVGKAAEDSSGLARKKELLDEQVREILACLHKDFPLDQVKTLRVGTAQQALIRKLGQLREKYVTRLESALDKIGELSHSIEELEKVLRGLEDPPGTSGLKLAIEEARRLGKIEEELAANRAEALKLKKDACAAIAAMGFWTGTLEELERLHVPDLETINDFDSRIRDSGAEVRKQETEIERLRDDLLRIRRDLEQLRLEQDVPTEDDLLSARQKRNEQWDIIRRTYEGNATGDDKKEASPDIPDAFEKEMWAADEIADRLRREADRVARYTALLSDRENGEAQITRVLSRKEDAVSELAKVNTAWEGAWSVSGIRPDSPGQMRRWAERHRRLMEISARVRELELKADSSATLIVRHEENLKRALSETGRNTVQGEGLALTVARCQLALEEFERACTVCGQVRRDLQKKQQELNAARVQEEKAKTGLSSWKDEWEEAIRPLGLGREAIPDQANEILAQLQDLFDKLRLAREYRTRIEQINEDERNFRNRVREFLERAAPDLANLSAEEAVTILHRSSTEAKTAKALKEGLEKRRRDEIKKKNDAAENIMRLGNDLRIMCEEAGCEQPEMLQEAEARSGAKWELTRQLEEVKAQLLELASGATLEDFISGAHSEDPDSIRPAVERLQEEIAALEAAKSEIDRAIGREENELNRMDGGGRAAEIAQEIQALLANIGTGVKRYSRLKVAYVLLADAVEKYRQRNQDPVLTRACALFRGMTLGSFEGLQIETDDRGNSIVAGSRGGGKESVRVEGMSDGTADQLYLALRLASLEHHMASNEPLPLILDDILIRFDNDRSVATLKILAELSEHTQILFFTHHRHLLERAESRDRPGAFDHSSSWK